MKDIDFDELDQAVSSVLKTPAEPAATPVETTPVVVDKPDAKTTESASAPAAVAAKTPLAIKRRGQFMDVVHPSSDMTGKPGETPSAPAQKVSIQPISKSVEPEVTAAAVETVPAATIDLAVPDVSEEPASAPTEVVEPAPADHAWPDPIDVMETQEEAKEPVVALGAVEDTAVEAPVPVEGAETPTEESAAETPFLPDTKVDKRPLDAFSAEENSVPTDGVATELTAMPAEPLPPELQPDVVAVEANPSDKPEEDITKEEPASVEKSSTPEPSFNASISQQYVAEENQAEEDHSIFDTREYHQPITPAKAKKRKFPGWLAAVLVILLLAGIGAAGGYFWFYYGI